MLRSIYIQNYALIEELDIAFSEGFSVITGETGGGKSIMLGAIGLLLGQRADTKSIRKGAAKCIIEARFNISPYKLQGFFDEYELEYDDECIFRRELHTSGKSRAFINDTPVSLPMMRELGEQLIDVHSQHQNLLLNKEHFQLGVLDVMARNDELLEHYFQSYKDWKELDKALKDTIEQAEKRKADEDYIRFQLEQLDASRLENGEQEELEEEAETLSHAEDIKSGLYKIHQLFNEDETGILSSLKDGLNTLESVSKIYPRTAELAERLESCYIELKDIAMEVAGSVDDIEFNPKRLERINERLNLIYSLQQKHRLQTVGELIALTNEYKVRLDEITSLDECIADLTQKRDIQFQKVVTEAAILTQKRGIAAREVEKEMVSRLIPLGMPNIHFVVEMGSRKEPGPNGADAVAFLFSANKNSTLQNISTVASGGEIARVMLTIKAIIAKAAKLPTIIFDEIDTGVSGEIADRMADIMEEMGKQERQVISITHLPQIAARGSAHYFVYKQDNDTETNSHIRKLNHEERVEEIAHMLSGATLTEAALNNAKELLKQTR